MKEFIEKLIERLEQEENEAVLKAPNTSDISNTEYQKWMMKSYGFKESIEIINQLAEEYKEKVIINGQYCWQTCSDTERCKECNRLCNGSIDYYENYDLLEEKYNNDFCEWKFIKSVADGGYFFSSGCNHKRFSDLHSFEYCPYCGKKIKVVEPKRE